MTAAKQVYKWLHLATSSFYYNFLVNGPNRQIVGEKFNLYLRSIES